MIQITLTTSELRYFNHNMTGQKSPKLTARNSGVWNWIFAGNCFFAAIFAGYFQGLSPANSHKKPREGNRAVVSVPSFESHGASVRAWQFDRWTQELERLRPNQKWGQLKKNLFFLWAKFWEGNFCHKLTFCPFNLFAMWNAARSRYTKSITDTKLMMKWSNK